MHTKLYKKYTYLNILSGMNVPVRLVQIDQASILNKANDEENKNHSKLSQMIVSHACINDKNLIARTHR